VYGIAEEIVVCGFVKKGKRVVTRSEWVDAEKGEVMEAGDRRILLERSPAGPDGGFGFE